LTTGTGTRVIEFTGVVSGVIATAIMAWLVLHLWFSRGPRVPARGAGVVAIAVVRPTLLGAKSTSVAPQERKWRPQWGRHPASFTLLRA
jgi:hypothetical protein